MHKDVAPQRRIEDLLLCRAISGSRKVMLYRSTVNKISILQTYNVFDKQKQTARLSGSAWNVLSTSRSLIIFIAFGPLTPRSEFIS